MSRTGSKSFVCTVCGKSFGRRPDLNRHAGIHDPDAERFYCAYPDCNHSSLQKSNLKTHYISKHLLQRQYEFNFEGCTKADNDVSSLIMHEKNQHRHYRKERKPYPSRDDRSLPRKKSTVKVEMVAPSPVPNFLATPSLCSSGNTSPSPPPSEATSTGFVPFFTLNPDPYTPQSSTAQTGDLDAFLHGGIVPDVFSEPCTTQYYPPGFGVETNFFKMADVAFFQAITQLDAVSANSVAVPMLR